MLMDDKAKETAAELAGGIVLGSTASAVWHGNAPTIVNEILKSIGGVCSPAGIGMEVGKALALKGVIFNPYFWLGGAALVLTALAWNQERDPDLPCAYDYL